MEQTNSIWFPLKDFEGIYEINEKSEVKSVIRETKTGRKPTGKILKQTIDRSGYYKVSLRKLKKPNTYFVHRLVALNFIDNPENKPWVNHKNSNRLDNSIDNLEWNTVSENNSHAHKFGGQKNYYGEKHSQSILTEKQVLEIRSKYVKGKITFDMLATEYKMSKGAIVAIIKRTTWKNI